MAASWSNKPINRIIYTITTGIKSNDVVAAKSLMRHGVAVHMTSHVPSHHSLSGKKEDGGKWEPFTASALRFTDYEELIRQLALGASPSLYSTAKCTDKTARTLVCIQQYGGEHMEAKESASSTLHEFLDSLLEHCIGKPLLLTDATDIDIEHAGYESITGTTTCLEDVAANVLGAGWIGDDTHYRFGPHRLPNGQVFYANSSVIAFTNIRPVINGHILVVPRRLIRRYAELTAEELRDMHTATQEIGAALEAHYGADALTITIQDGSAAGQTVPHLHIHLLPRWEEDLPFAQKDEVYGQIDRSEQLLAPSHAIAVDPFPHVAAGKRIIPGSAPAPRSAADMQAEAAVYAALFPAAERVMFLPKH